jgi:hypothetical protein
MGNTVFGDCSVLLEIVIIWEFCPLNKINNTLYVNSQIRTSYRNMSLKSKKEGVKKDG